MSSSGPRSLFLVSTAASLWIAKFADAAWNSGWPGEGIVYFANSSFDSSSGIALPKP